MKMLTMVSAADVAAPAPTGVPAADDPLLGGDGAPAETRGYCMGETATPPDRGCAGEDGISCGVSGGMPGAAGERR